MASISSARSCAEAERPGAEPSDSDELLLSEEEDEPVRVGEGEAAGTQGRERGAQNRG